MGQKFQNKFNDYKKTVVICLNNIEISFLISAT